MSDFLKGPKRSDVLDTAEKRRQLYQDREPTGPAITPITHEQLKPIQQTIYNFLASRPGETFTGVEIAQNLRLVEKKIRHWLVNMRGLPDINFVIARGKVPSRYGIKNQKE